MTTIFSSAFSPTSLDAPSAACRATRNSESGARRHRQSQQPLPAKSASCFFTVRVWSESEQEWIGRERNGASWKNSMHSSAAKAVTPMIVLRLSRQALAAGDFAMSSRWIPIPSCPPEAARRLMETIAHPLNRVEIDPVTRVRRRGYTIIQPRVSITLPGATATRFTRIFADASGHRSLLPDGFRRPAGSFSGSHFPWQSHLRCARLPRDPGRPVSRRNAAQPRPDRRRLRRRRPGHRHRAVRASALDYASFASRQHRWIRGDWQIAAGFSARSRQRKAEQSRIR